jgi:hypothetical protein
MDSAFPKRTLPEARATLIRVPPLLSLTGSGCDSGGHSFGMRSVLLIIIEPDATKSSTSGCRCHGPIRQTPQ